MKHKVKKSITKTNILVKLRHKLKGFTTSTYVIDTRIKRPYVPSSTSVHPSFKSRLVSYTNQLQVECCDLFVKRTVAKLNSLECILTKQQKTSLRGISECDCIFTGQESKGLLQPYRITTDVCDECESALKKDHSKNVFVCTSCGKSISLLDCSQDLIKNKQRTRYRYSRRPLYHKYLTQFSVTTEDPPDEVLLYVKRKLWDTHILSIKKAKMTPIINILSKSKYKSYTWLTARIIKLITGQEIPLLPTELINTITDRFVNDFNGTGNFSYITHRLLCLEGRADLAQHFAYMKTKNVLRHHDGIFIAQCIENGYNSRHIHPLI